MINEAIEYQFSLVTDDLNRVIESLTQDMKDRKQMMKDLSSDLKFSLLQGLYRLVIYVFISDENGEFNLESDYL